MVSTRNVQQAMNAGSGTLALYIEDERQQRAGYFLRDVTYRIHAELQLTGKGRVIGVDIDIREHNRNAIEQHPMYRHITMIQGSSVDAAVVDQVRQMIMPGEVVMVLLDSNHTHDHVIQEMKLYHNMVTPGSYLVVFDTIIEDMPRGMYNRPWDVGNNAKTAVIEFLRNHPEFEIDHEMDNKLLISVAPQGYLRRTK